MGVAGDMLRYGGAWKPGEGWRYGTGRGAFIAEWSVGAGEKVLLIGIGCPYVPVSGGI